MTQQANDDETQSVEYKSRALVKLARARELFESLEQAIDRWNDEHQLMAPARSPHEGEQRLEIFRPEIIEQTPWDHWESIFHDGVHNLRVALDTLCYELCHLERPHPRPRDIYFPITDGPRDWERKSKNLETIPVALLERIRECQAWARPDRQDPDPLALIAAIDNVDKHRASGAVFDVVPMGQWELRPSAPLPDHLANSLEWPLTPWLTASFTPPIERGRAFLLPVMALPIVTFQGSLANVPDAQRSLHSEVHRFVSFIASGEWPETPPTRFLPGPLWSRLPAV